MEIKASVSRINYQMRHYLLYNVNNGLRSSGMKLLIRIREGKRPSARDIEPVRDGKRFVDSRFLFHFQG